MRLFPVRSDRRCHTEGVEDEPNDPPRVSMSYAAEVERPPRRHITLNLSDERTLSEIATALGLDDRDVRALDPARELPIESLSYVALDCETSGLNPEEDDVIELGAILVENGVETARVSTLVRSERELPKEVAEITHIDEGELRRAAPFADALEALLPLLARADFVLAYNAPFDRAFLNRACARGGLSLPKLPWIDVLVLVRQLDRYQRGKNLADVARRWEVEASEAHRALPDAKTTARLFKKLLPWTRARTLAELVEAERRWKRG